MSLHVIQILEGQNVQILKLNAIFAVVFSVSSLNLRFTKHWHFLVFSALSSRLGRS